MKKTILKILAIAIFIALLVLVYNLWQSHRHSPDSMKRDAEEHVMKLLTKLYENDKESYREFIFGDLIVITDRDIIQTWFDCNPHWNPNDVSITRSEIDPSDSSYVNVYVSHKKQASLFRVHMSYQTFTSRHAAYITVNFLNFDEKKKGLNVPLKPKYTFPLNQCMDDNHGDGSIIFAEEALNAVNKFLKSLKNKKACKYYYPEIGTFYNYLTIDSTSLKVRNIVLINQKFKFWSDYTFKYEVYCSDSLYFIYDSDKQKIVDSYGLYDYTRRLEELSNIEDYPSFNSLKSSLNESESDLHIISQVKKIRSDIDEKIQEQKQREYIQNRMNYYKRVGLVIEEIKMIRGKDRDGDITKGFSCSIFNPTDKTIKYITFHLWAINGVGDSMGYPHTFKGIGPIEPSEYGTYSDDNMFVDVNNVIDDISVNIVVQYTDGTKKNVKLKDALATPMDFDKEWWTYSWVSLYQ